MCEIVFALAGGEHYNKTFSCFLLIFYCLLIVIFGMTVISNGLKYVGNLSSITKFHIPIPFISVVRLQFLFISSAFQGSL